MGEIEVPAGALWGAQTERARRNFQHQRHAAAARISSRALALIKAAAARANAALGLLPADVADAIVEAAMTVAARHARRAVSVDVFQTGSGTSTNMNANEVIARLASTRARQAGACQRSREHGPEQQRRDPDRDPRQRGAGLAPASCCPRWTTA